VSDSTTATAEASAAPQAKNQPIWQIISSFTQARVMRLQGGYLKDSGQAKAELARLRSVDPSDDARVIDAWATAFVDAPAALIGLGEKPSDAEYAVATALHLYSVHQQSRGEKMHVNGEGLGRAVRKLARPEDIDSREKPVMRRYQSLISATDRNEIVRHLRSLVQQFRSEGIPLDYARLAQDLYFLAKPALPATILPPWTTLKTSLATHPQIDVLPTTPRSNP
jgi:CRISPR system Cascade subunit CasB